MQPIHYIYIWVVVQAVCGLLRWLDWKYWSSPISITLTPSGAEFSEDWKYSLLKRRARNWDDVQSVDFIPTPRDAKKTWLSLESEFDARFGPKLYIDFTSGGIASIALARLDAQQRIALFRCLEKNVSATKFSSAAVAIKEQALSEIRDTSFTELWNDDIAMRHASTNFMPLPGGHRLQAGRLRVLSELASGGLSAVYLVESEGHQGNLVLKESVLPLDLNEQAKTKARELFQREAQILTKLDHPNIVRVHDCFVDRGRDYLLMEHISGRTLRQSVSENGRMDAGTVIQTGIRLCDIVAYLHEQEPPVVHRDLTPDNVIRNSDGEVYLIDFGAANLFVGQATGTMIGKKSYISAEQFRGKAEPASDIYSLGATLFFLLTGEDPLALSTSKPDDAVFGGNLCEIVERCTQMNLEDRYQSIQDVRNDLIAAQENPS